MRSAFAVVNLRCECLMRVLLFIRSLDVGGSQRQLLLLAHGLARRGHDVAIAVFYTGDEIDTAQQQSRVRVLPLAKSRRWDVIGPASRLRRLIRRENPDVLYAFLPAQTTLASFMLPRHPRTRLVFGLRAAGMEADKYDYLSALLYRSEALLARRTDLIIANAQAGRADGVRRGMPADRIAVVVNGIDTHAMHPDPAGGRAQRQAWGIPDDAFVMGCVARYDPMKDHRNFLTAAASFARLYSDAWFVCLGHGPAQYLDELKAFAGSLGLADRLGWAYVSGAVQSAYNAFDIATLASAFGEGFPNVIGEAMACGIPVAATDVGDVRRIVGGLGEVVPPHDPNGLAAGWTRLRQRLSQNPNLRVMARDAIVANYGVEAMVARTEDILTQLCAGRRPQEIARDFA